jgi:hypothetical protein
MAWFDEYSSENAFWLALRSRAGEQAKSGRVPSQELLRMFVMQQFMTRVFEQPSAPWIVAGGTNLLIRVPGARSTRDIDLNTASEHYGTIDSIRAEMEPLAGDNPDLDPFTYEIDDQVKSFTGGLRGSSWKITATIGGDRAAVFGLDLAADDAITVSDIERHQAPPVIDGVRGLSAPAAVPLFPLESQLADKIASVSFRDQKGRSTHRYRDLVDLAIYAGHVDVDADKLRQALHRRATARNRPVPNGIHVSEGWADGYRSTASVTNLPAGLHTVEAATDAVVAWLDPLLQGEVPEDSIWDHLGGVWRSRDDAATKPGHVWVRPHTRDGHQVIEYYRRRPQPSRL